MDGGGDVAQERGGGGVDGVAGLGGEVGYWWVGLGGLALATMGRGGGGEVGVADGEEVGVEGGDVVVL